MRKTGKKYEVINFARKNGFRMFLSGVNEIIAVPLGLAILMIWTEADTFIEKNTVYSGGSDDAP